MHKKLIHKTAIITGGASGIGKAIAEVFALEGAVVHLFDRDAPQVASVAAAIVQAGGSAFSHCVDLCDGPAVQQAVATIGAVDILVNNAGVAHVGNLEKCSAEDFDRVFQVNVKGAYQVLAAVVPQMKAHGGGSIVHMSSIAAHVGIADRFAYSMSKGAIKAMSLSIARDYLGDHIRSNSISPARVHTPFVDGFVAKNYPGQEAETMAKLSASQPMGRMAQPQEIAQLALFLASDDSAFISGNDYPIDGGFIHLNN